MYVIESQYHLILLPSLFKSSDAFRASNEIRRLLGHKLRPGKSYIPLNYFKFSLPSMYWIPELNQTFENVISIKLSLFNPKNFSSKQLDAV